VRRLSLWIAACVAGLAAATASPALAAPDAAQETTCKSFVLGKLGDAASIADATGLIRTVADPVSANPCHPDWTATPVTAAELASLSAEIDRRRAAYQCDSLGGLAVCQGLAAAGSRLHALPSVAGTAEPGGPLRWDADYKWNLTYGAFGTGPNGVSFLKLVLQGTPAASVSASVTPATRYANYPAPAGPCDPMCRRSVAEVLALYPLFSELDWFFQKGVAAPAYAEQAKEAKIARAKWDAYLFGGGDARVQLPWELAVNSVIYKTNQPRPEPGDYPEPPRVALTLLHPSVGITLKNSKGADGNVAGVVELIGLSRWRYDPDDGSRRNEWGLSAISAYQPRDGGRDWGYGALLRTPWHGLNVAWVRAKTATGHDDQILFSVDPSSLLPKLTGSATCLFGVGDCGKP
jgi:hypothetical protein